MNSIWFETKYGYAIFDSKNPFFITYIEWFVAGEKPYWLISEGKISIVSEFYK